jgi:hypothetical protein
MNEQDSLNNDKLAEMETQAITDIAKRWKVSEGLINEIIQDYTEAIEKFERYLNENYPDDDMNTQPYVVMEITQKATRDIAGKHDLDEEVVRMIIQGYTAMIHNSFNQEMLEDLE